MFKVIIEVETRLEACDIFSENMASGRKMQIKDENDFCIVASGECDKFIEAMSKTENLSHNHCDIPIFPTTATKNWIRPFYDKLRK